VPEELFQLGAFAFLWFKNPALNLAPLVDQQSAHACVIPSSAHP
jgi:hypothetical protein